MLTQGEKLWEVVQSGVEPMKDWHRGLQKLGF